MNARSCLRPLVGAALLTGTIFVAACGSDRHVTTTTTDRTVTTEQPASPMAQPGTSTTTTTTQRSHD